MVDKPEPSAPSPPERKPWVRPWSVFLTRAPDTAVLRPQRGTRGHGVLLKKNN